MRPAWWSSLFSGNTFKLCYYTVLGGEPLGCCVKSLRGKARKRVAVPDMLSSRPCGQFGVCSLVQIQRNPRRQMHCSGPWHPKMTLPQHDLFLQVKLSHRVLFVVKATCPEWFRWEARTWFQTHHRDKSFDIPRVF